MGNSASKKAKLEQLEKDCAQTTSDLAAREQELARTQKGLEASKSQEQALSSETDALRKKNAEIADLSKTLEEERTKQITKLQDDLRLKSDEATACRRVVESRTQERDDARRQMKQMEEKSQLSLKEMQDKVQQAEQTHQLSHADFETRRKELELTAATQSAAIQEAQSHSAALASQLQDLQQKHSALTLQLSTAQTQAEQTLLAAHASAEQKFATLRAQSASELALAQTSMTDSQRTLTSLTTELAQTKTALAAATAKVQNLTLTHNESVTRRTASYEAFTATKQELADTQGRFLALHEAHEKLKGEKDGAVKAEREAKEAAMMEVAALRKKLVESEARKGFSDVSVQQLSVGVA